MEWKTPTIAERYKPAEAMTRPFALQLVRQAGIDRFGHNEKALSSETDNLVILDNACGTGIVSAQLYDVLSDSARESLELICGDISDGMLEAVGQTIKENGWRGAKTQKIDAQAMDLPSNYFTHVLTNFGVVGLALPHTALDEMYRILRPGGTVALSTWEEVGWYPYLEDAVRTLPGPPPMPTWPEFSNSSVSPEDPSPRLWHAPSYVAEQVAKHRFKDVRVVMLPNETRHENAEAFCRVNGAILEAIVQNFWSEQENKGLKKMVRPALVKTLEKKFGDGEVTLKWTAACITAKKPAQ